MTQATECVPCSEGTGVLDQARIEEGLESLPGWEQRDNTIFKRYAFKGFAKATQMANLVAWHSDKMGHHADISFGWGYCEVVYTSHEAGGLTENDFLCAIRLEALLD
ncbi:4a-hydroxytetrahydrobiopterin dehydratase [Cognatishimia activa]|uniref:4a-hydroxytetrahydrobiopterin dehydratase n=1 Tax=Cognatishimia activa TaxID=1715691 RepID=A0A0N7MBX3_9RHOB|nr:4a-hydroxytetrahydrobiopterin dehydratase [Cognatishimia activa]CUI71805.1 Putative pterin-4-alpha-carbinolamine dehydratase [Cognatishimia activa]CUK26608.1 Putative pterin-4-alpha-carbinolamine dehydratase [Cognatishimia activa]